MKKKDTYNFIRIDNKLIELIFLINYSVAKSRCNSKLVNVDDKKINYCKSHNSCPFYKMSRIYPAPLCKYLLSMFFPQLIHQKYNKYNIRRIIKFLDHYYQFLKNEYS